LIYKSTTFFFSHGAKSNTCTKGGTVIILSPLVVQTWKLAGQPDPIQPGKIAGATRVMALELHFRDNTNKTTKLFVISTYLPCSSYRNNEYKATLAELDRIMGKCPTDAIPIIGGDFNASIGTANADKELYDSPVGCHGNSHQNDNSDKLRDFLYRHKLCSITMFFKTRCRNTWSFNGDGSRSFQIDHILAKREELNQFTNCDTIAGVKSGHTAVAAIIRIAKFIPKKQKQSHQKTKPPEGNQTGNQTKKERSKRAPVDW
jgi:hypothetical protein